MLSLTGQACVSEELALSPEGKRVFYNKEISSRLWMKMSPFQCSQSLNLHLTSKPCWISAFCGVPQEKTKGERSELNFTAQNAERDPVVVV